MSLELVVVIIFGTLSCILGAVQLWISFHQYYFWLLHLRGVTKSAFQSQQDTSLPDMDVEASCPSSLSSSSFTTCNAESLTPS